MKKTAVWLGARGPVLHHLVYPRTYILNKRRSTRQNSERIGSRWQLKHQQDIGAVVKEGGHDMGGMTTWPGVAGEELEEDGLQRTQDVPPRPVVVPMLLLLLMTSVWMSDRLNLLLESNG
jgi:hypothetical protein